MLIDVQIIYIRVMFNWDTALLNVLHTLPYLLQAKSFFAVCIVLHVSYRDLVLVIA